MFFILVMMTRLKIIQPFAQGASLDPAYSLLIPTVSPQPTALPTAIPPPTAVVTTFPTITPLPTSVSSPSPTPTAAPASTANSGYVDGIYTHKPIELHGGTLQLQVAFSNGKMEDITFLEYPHASNTSQVINEKVLPRLRLKALENQRAKIDFISGASTTCNAFDYALRAIVSKATPDA